MQHDGGLFAEHDGSSTLASDFPESVDVVVIGAGIIGAAIARELAVAGISVAIVEAKEPGGGTSGKCDGNILVQTKLHEPELLLTRHAIARYRNWDEELPGDFHLEQQGSLVFFTTEEQAAAGAERHRLLAALGVHSELLSEAEVREREPAIDGPLIGGLDCAEDASVYPPFVVYGLLADAVHRGARLITGTRVHQVLSERGRVVGVETDRGRISARWIVNALGIWADSVEVATEIRIPIVPRQGVLLVTEACPGLLQRTVTEGAYMTLRGKGTPDDPKPRPVFVAEPTFRGNLLIGSSRRFVGMSDDVAPGLMLDMVRHATSFVSKLGEIRIIRAFAGLRPWTPDSYPLVGTVGDLDGYLLAAGHEGEGIALAPVTADMVVQLITGRHGDPVLERPFDLFDPRRMQRSMNRTGGK